MTLKHSLNDSKVSPTQLTLILTRLLDPMFIAHTFIEYSKKHQLLIKNIKNIIISLLKISFNKKESIKRILSSTVKDIPVL